MVEIIQHGVIEVSLGDIRSFEQGESRSYSFYTRTMYIKTESETLAISLFANDKETLSNILGFKGGVGS